MGLDMYLYRYQDVEKRRHKDRELWLQWRKANAIHGWFVTEIQGGVDDGNEYPVSREKLVELMGLCLKTQSRDPNEARSLLPAMAGPFFGRTDYGELYYDELEYTAKQLKILLDTPESEKVYFYYYAWW
ncbi:hypothetical protein [Planococcus halotolerans]|uniref:hypothetical protein n=1 Tax=Planococcus halotolerans TaxID=2233542 RepID=UPI00109295FA|nr:hypothetical protein [Planococcus halotolerans]QHJ70581.1 hypothetical protein DNR44_008170 [Planococcus halotolerans]